MSEVLYALDGEHAELLARLARFRDKVLEGKNEHVLRENLDSVHDALVRHFRDEEDAMRRFHYGGYVAHRDEHLVIWTAYLRLADACHRTKFGSRCADLMFNTMNGLLSRHIDRFDRGFLEYVRRRIPK